MPLSRRQILSLIPFALTAQTPDFSCPMDPDVRSKNPGKCPRCGMKLEARIADLVEYPTEFRFVPPQLPAGKPVEIYITVHDPKSQQAVTHYEVMHEKLMHLFLYSSDLSFFAHLHPEQRGETFVLPTVLPKPGIYKLIADFYPAGGTPQFAEKIVTTAGYTRTLEESLASPPADTAPQHGTNLDVELRMDPPTPVPGRKTMLFVKVNPAKGLEPYIGAWAHMLVASNDLLDSIHEHPEFADGGPEMQFNVFFPRAATYRIWIQFQRLGTVNTVAFTVPVKPLTNLL